MILSALFFTLLVVCVNGDADGSKSYDILFSHAMDAYRNKNHGRSVILINEALEDYNFDREVSAQCWLKCREEFTKARMRYTSILDGQLNFLHYSIKMKACSKLCKEKFLGERPVINDKTRDFFKKREPYKFMQYSYTQTGNWEKALQTAYTYLEANPDNSNMRETIGSLLQKVEITPEELLSLEERRHIALYRFGELAYFAKNYSAAIEYFEESHMLFYKEVEKCIGLCEEQMETKEMFHAKSLYLHYKDLISCRQACRHELATGKTDTPPDKYVQLYYDFLQFSYFQVNQPYEAAVACLTFLYLMPDDEKMKNNLKFYQTKPGVRGKNLKPRPHAVKFYRQLSLESSLIIIAQGLSKKDAKNVDASNKILDAQAREEIQHVHESVLDEIASASGPTKGDSEIRNVKQEGRVPKYNAHSLARAYRDQARWKRNPEIKHAKLLMEEQELNGTNRVAFDDVIDEETCKTLRLLVKNTAVSGDGYQHSHKDSKHPFTQKEEFEGVSVAKAVESYKIGSASYKQVKTYFDVSENMRLLTQEYFGLDRLGIAYTHLVCRHALPGEVNDGGHLSHPIHSDNCVNGGDGPGTCPKRDPAYTWRDYSALLYLNDDFEGGEFIFADYKKQVTAKVKPKCGRLVSFQSKGVENLHGVQGVKKGSRCAVALWFTLSNVSEDDRAQFIKKLNILKHHRDKKQEL